MIAAMRRLHERGRDSRGVAVDRDGAMLGPDCVLVRRTSSGFRCLAPGEAAAIQTAILGPKCKLGWLFDQTRRIADTLAKDEIALAQIHGLRIPIAELDDPTLQRLAATASLIKANFDPDQPRVPAGNPDGGQWTDTGGSEETPASSGSSGTGDADWPGAGDGEGWPESDASPAIEDSPDIPTEPPDTARERNSLVRRAAEWLRQAAALGARRAPDTRVRAFLRALEGTAWVAEYLPEIWSYLDRPKTLSELQDAVSDRRAGYQIHHIVEGHYGSRHPLRNSEVFGGRLESSENLVLIPRWKHVEISSWYSKANVRFSGMTPRAYLRGKGWDEQYRVGLETLRDFGVLK